MEIRVATPFSVCMERDPKGWYRRVSDGEVECFSGIDAPCETPMEPGLCMDCGKHPPHAAIEIIWARLCDRKLMNEDLFR
ncbi:MAG: adenylyl-sulfate kinase [Acidiferrobacteraceae bacterium]